MDQTATGRNAAVQCWPPGRRQPNHSTSPRTRSDVSHL